jgi:hypothetical protein
MLREWKILVLILPFILTYDNTITHYFRWNNPLSWVIELLEVKVDDEQKK